MGMDHFLTALAAVAGLAGAAVTLAAWERLARIGLLTRDAAEKLPGEAARFVTELCAQRQSAAPPRARAGLFAWLGLSLWGFAAVPFGPLLATSDGAPLLWPTFVPGLAAGLLWTLAAWGLSNAGEIAAAESPAEIAAGLRRCAGAMALLFATLGAVATGGTLSIEGLIDAQTQRGVWNAVLHPIGCLAFVLCAQFFAGPARPRDSESLTTDEDSRRKTRGDAVAPIFYPVPALRRAFPAAAQSGLTLQRLLLAYVLVEVYLGGWHLWWLAGEPAPVSSWSAWAIAFAVLHAKVLLTVWCWTRFGAALKFGEVAWLAAVPLGLIDLGLAIAPFEWLVGDDAWLARAAAGWCGLAAILGLAPRGEAAQRR